MDEYLKNHFSVKVFVKSRAKGTDLRIEKCIICDKELTSKGVFLCESDILKLYNKLNTKLEINNNPTFKEHCMICGEWENRVITNFPTWDYICNICLRRAVNIYSARNE